MGRNKHLNGAVNGAVNGAIKGPMGPRFIDKEVAILYFLIFIKQIGENSENTIAFPYF